MFIAFGPPSPPPIATISVSANERSSSDHADAVAQSSMPSLFAAMATTSSIKNMQANEFSERVDIGKIIDELLHISKDPYTASLPLIASAELGDTQRYEKTLQNMDQQLKKNFADIPEWMRNTSFQAWMWGRILLAADSMHDNKTSEQAIKTITILLKKQANLAFSTWAWGYLAALNIQEYNFCKEKMMKNADKLATEYKKKQTQENLSNTLWAYIMNLFAAANANDKEIYTHIKNEIKLLTAKSTVTEALNTGLLRTSQSNNDYPAWGLAKIRLAAATMNDLELYEQIQKNLESSIQGAKKVGAQGEYILAVLDNQLAMQRFEHLKTK